MLIEAFDLPEPTLVCRLVEGAAKRGAVPLVSWKSNAVLRSLYRTATDESMKLAGELEAARMEQVQAYIGIRGAANSSQFADVPQEKMDLYQQHWWKPVHTEIRVPKTKWVVLRYPTDSFAQAANMSTAAFEDFYFDVCTADYAAMKKAQEPLVARMKQADRVRIVAPGTELEFSIKGIPVIACWGERNIPDGEVFTAPVRDSINGKIRFNTQSRYQGTVFDNIEFEFKNGKIVRATANETEKINADSRFRRRRPLLRRVGDRRQQSRAAPDARHAVRRKDRRLVPPHARQRLRNRRQRQPQPHPLGPGADPAARLRRRRNLVRRRAGPQRRPLPAEDLRFVESGHRERLRSFHGVGMLCFRAQEVELHEIVHTVRRGHVVAAFCAPVYAITYTDFVTSADLSSVLSNNATIGFTYAGNKFVGSVYFGTNNNQLYSDRIWSGGGVAPLRRADSLASLARST